MAQRGKVELHLLHNGYKSNYKTWTAHGERRFQEPVIEGFGETDRVDDMLADLAAAAPSLGANMIFLFHRMITMLLLRLNIQMIMSSSGVMDSLTQLWYTKVVVVA